MADKKRKSQAEKAAGTPARRKKASVKEKSSASQNEKRKVPGKVISSIVFLVLFIIFLLIALRSEGALLLIIKNVVLGLMGKAAFYVSIPAFLYLFIVHAFSRNRKVGLQTVSTLLFVLLCGCISHLTLNSQNAEWSLSLFPLLYQEGIAGTSAGVICGLIAMGIRFLCGNILSYIIFILCGILALLGAMQITIPSIVRAIQNRPRPDWEEKDAEPAPEPAEVVVNHIANKHIEHVEQQRISRAEKAAAEKEAREARETIQGSQVKMSEMMHQIGGDVDEPVAAARRKTKKHSKKEVLSPAPEEDYKEADSEEGIDLSVPDFCETEPIPAHMPELIPDEPLPEAPVLEETPAPQPVSVQDPALKKVTSKEAQTSAAEIAQTIQENAASGDKPEYCFPPIDLLDAPRKTGASGTEEMRENSRRLNETLESFRIEAHIINVTRGPSVTRYEVELEKGVRLNKLTTAADDIALSLGASGVRIAAVPGKISVVGIEVPNKTVTTVSLREVIDSPEFRRARSKSSFAVGKDISGSCIVGNIAKLPHMLIAGTTGSGKSVCMNSIIISLLYKAAPEEVKLIMIDPKMVELGIYNGIPHLLIPVVTDPKKAAGSLQWAVVEMMRRYRAMSDAGVRDIESYNSIIESQEIDGEKLPQVVVIIDELADLMLVAAKEVEESICRIAQMGRAAGIHLIIATQRPSADVITGLMKANIPSRIAFAVASAMESRIILDTQGAEKLVGKGDMLYAPIGNGKPKRVQGCFVSDSEVEAVASYIKENYTTSYDQSVIDEIDKKAAQTGSKSSSVLDPAASAEDDCDEMLPSAVEVILETGQASVSMLQRRLKLGYARAARIVDEMEDRGIVGPFQGSKPRSILITKEQWAAMQSGEPAQMDFNELEEEPSESDDES